MSTIAHGIALLLAREEHDTSQPNRCRDCNRAYSPVTGKTVEKPFIWRNPTEGICSGCNQERLRKGFAR